MDFLIIITLIVLGIGILVLFNKPVMEKPFWQTHLNIPLSTQEFYTSIEEIIQREEIQSLRAYRVTHFESGLFSARRESLRIKRKKAVIEICGFLFGQGFYIACRRGRVPSLHKKLFPPEKSKLGKFLDSILSINTFYSNDSEEAFDSMVILSVETVVEFMAKGRGIRSIGESKKYNGS